MKKNLVSIITPMYNSGKFIKEWESRQDVKRELGLCLSTALALNIKAGSYYWSNEKVD